MLGYAELITQRTRNVWPILQRISSF